MSRYELVSHTADVSIRLHATEEEGLQGLFLAGAEALYDLLFEDTFIHETDKEQNHRASEDSVHAHSPLLQGNERFSISASDPELLLIDWLSSILHHSTMYKRAYISFEVEIFSPTRLSIVATYVEEVPSREIKGVTMHNLKITFDGTEWQTQVTVDI
jgi:SHS2 domain-containing protein